VRNTLGIVLLLLVLLTWFVGIADAQVNKAVCSTQCILPVPVEPGDTLIAMGIWPLGMTNTTIFDPKPNKWEFMGFLNGRTICVWYALDTVGGAETLTLPPGMGVEAILVEYPPSSGPDDSSMAMYHDGSGDLVADSNPVTTSVRGDFVIGLFSSWPTGFAVSGTPDRGYETTASIGWLTLVDKMAVPKGTYSPSLTYAQPVLNDVWVIAFKAKAIEVCKP
jgi:hypothetical protein